MPHALAEADFRNHRAKHIVYGHTHLNERVPLDASHTDGYVLSQMYFNAGTWRGVHRPARETPLRHDFIASDEMTWLVFYQGDERKGRPYETWSASLGAAPSETTIHRIDQGRVSHVSGQSVSAPVFHEHAPHFTALPLKTGLLSGRRVK